MITTEIISFVTVLFTAVCVASLISILYAWGLRLWADGSVDAQGNAHLLHRVVSVICFTACISIVLFALWLDDPHVPLINDCG